MPRGLINGACPATQTIDGDMGPRIGPAKAFTGYRHTWKHLIRSLLVKIRHLITAPINYSHVWFRERRFFLSLFTAPSSYFSPHAIASLFQIINAREVLLIILMHFNL